MSDQLESSKKRKWKSRGFIQKLHELEDCNQQQEWQISYIRQIGHEHIGTGELEKKTLGIRALENLRDSTIEQQTVIQTLLTQIKKL
jgi:hypothetical protein